MLLRETNYSQGKLRLVKYDTGRIELVVVPKKVVPGIKVRTVREWSYGSDEWALDLFETLEAVTGGKR